VWQSLHRSRGRSYRRRYHRRRRRHRHRCLETRAPARNAVQPTNELTVALRIFRNLVYLCQRHAEYDRHSGEPRLRSESGLLSTGLYHSIVRLRRLFAPAGSIAEAAGADHVIGSVREYVFHFFPRILTK